MKTRSEWGSNEDWADFCTYHQEWNFSKSAKGSGYPAGGYYQAAVGGILVPFFATTLQEARRLAVQHFCAHENIALPWRPDFDLSTIAGCKEAIKSCGYSVNMPGLSGTITLIQIEDTLRSKNVNVIPGLESWQQAAQFAIDNHEH